MLNDMKKLTLLLAFVLILATVLASCSGNYDEGQPDLSADDDDQTGDTTKVDVKYNLKYQGYIYNIYDGKEIEITGYDFDYTDDAETAAAAEDGEEIVETVSLEIPAKIDGISVTKIGKNAFAKNSVLASVVIPEGVSEIGDEAFWYNYALESVTLPASVKVLGKRVFNYCSSLEAIEIPANITEIPEAICGECTALESVTFKGEVTSIGDFAFAYCTSLASIDLGDSLVTVGASAFRWCMAIESLNIPTTVKTIGDGAFAYCTALTAIQFGQVKEIGEGAFLNCAEDAVVTFTGSDKTTVVVGKYNDVITEALEITVK